MFTYEISKEHNHYKGMIVYDRMEDGTPAGWRIEAEDDYVFYDASVNSTEVDPLTMEKKSVNYYYKVAMKPRTYRWYNFHYVAVKRELVNEKYIFG